MGDGGNQRNKYKRMKDGIKWKRNEKNIQIHSHEGGNIREIKRDKHRRAYTVIV